MLDLTSEIPAGDLAETLRTTHVGLKAVEIRRRGKVIKRWGLTTSENAEVGADDVPEDTPEDLHAAIIDKCETHAQKHGGRGTYNVALERAGKPDKVYAVVLGEEGADTVKARIDETAFTLFSKTGDMVVKICGEFAKLIDRQSSMMEKIGDAHVRLMEARETASSNAVHLAMLSQKAASDERREKLAAGALMPFLGALRKRIEGNAPASEQQAQTVDPLVVKARAFYRSLDAEQIAKLRASLGASTIDALRDGDAPAIASACATVIALPDSETEAALDVLRVAEQGPLLSALLEGASAWRAPEVVPALPAATSVPALAAATSVPAPAIVDA